MTWMPIEEAPKDWTMILGEELSGNWWLVYWDEYASVWRDQMDNVRMPVKWHKLPEPDIENDDGH